VSATGCEVVEQDTVPGHRQLAGPGGWAFWTGTVWKLFNAADQLKGLTDASSVELHEVAARRWCAS